MKCERRAAARTFPVRAVASSSTSSFAPPPTSSFERDASKLGADADFDFESGFGADSDFGTGKASTSLHEALEHHTPTEIITTYNQTHARKLAPI
ncbi:Uncharacterised protein [Chlamydia trachomatis]|nr:Uncharacterised protein [Chlamydia trachomatis]